MPAPIDFSGWIPASWSTTIIQEATQQSAALQLCTRVPMGTSVTEMPVPKTFPKAAWVSAPGGRKPFTDLQVGAETMKAEEVAAVVGIPNVYIEDSSINLWAFVRPLLAEAIAAALDDAVIFGTDAPASFPTGGLAAMALAASAGTDVADTLNNAFMAVENSGLSITGSAADIAVRGALRNARDSDGAMLCGCDWIDGRERTSLFGYPIAYVPLSETAPDFITGAWRYAILGVRQDIRYDLSNQAVVADDAGNVVISAWQDNTTLMKVWARFAFVVVRPVTRRCPNGATPFAKATLADGAARCATPSGPASAICTRNGCGHPATDHEDDGTGACTQPPPGHCEEFEGPVGLSATPAAAPRPRRTTRRTPST
jgi:HK97 family phage major capsid protein